MRICNDQLMALTMRKVTITIKKPFYVGFVVLELSKLHMFKYVAFHMSLLYVIPAFHYVTGTLLI